MFASTFWHTSRFVASVLLFFIWHAANAQPSVKKSYSTFNETILRLGANPSEFQVFTMAVHRDSLVDYYRLLQDEFTKQHTLLNTEQRAFWQYQIGSAQQILGKVDSAITIYNNVSKYVDIKTHGRQYLELQLKLGDAYRMRGNKKKSNQVLLNALEMPAAQTDSVFRIRCLGFIAENYETLSEYKLAFETIMTVYKYRLIKKEYARASYNLIQLGRLGSHLENDTSYFEYFHMANRMAAKSGDTARMENNLVNTAYIYRQEGFPLKSLTYLKAAKPFAAYSNMHSHIYSLLHLSYTYIDLDSISTAIHTAKNALALAQKHQANSWIIDANEILAKCYIIQNKQDSASSCLYAALAHNKKFSGVGYLINIYKQLSIVHANFQQYELAMAYLDSSYAEYNRYVAATNEGKLAQSRAKSDYELHRTRIAELVLNNQLEQERSKKLAAIVYGVSGTVIILIVFSILLRRRLKQLQESHLHLTQKNIELDKLNTKLYEEKAYTKKKPKHENNGRDDEIINALYHLLRDKEIFTNPNVSLKMLADKLHTNTSYLSGAINTHFHCNLPRLINQYRIEKARQMLVNKDYKNYSVEGIATEVGYKSRAVFYQAFKTITGLSPSVYVQNYQKATLKAD